MEYKEAPEKYLEMHVNDIKVDDPGKAFGTLKILGAKPGDELDNSSFEISDHLEKNLTDLQSVERIAEHFSKISQEYPSLNMSDLSKSVKQKLNERHSANLPIVLDMMWKETNKKVKLE